MSERDWSRPFARPTLRPMDAISTGRQARAPVAASRVTRGAYRLSDSPDVRISSLHAWQLALPPEAAFTHLTGGGIHEVWLPPTDGLPVWISLPYGVPRPERPGLRVVRRHISPAPVIVNGLRCETAAQCLLIAARDLHELDLTCLIEGMRHRGVLSERDEDRLLSEAYPGSPRLRRAFGRATGGSETIWEVLLRELHRACDVAVEAQHVIFDADGVFVARADLWLLGTRRIHEHDGGAHLDREQHRRDLKRDRRLGASDWERRGYTSNDVLHQAVSILRDADQALGRPHNPARIRAWHALLKRSLFSPAGQQLLRDRIRASL
jgi:very-short-patch-repair endonuclease